MTTRTTRGAAAFVRRFTKLATLCGLVALALPAAAQPYPSKAIRIVVPFAVGTTTDLISRFVGQKLSDALGQPVIIDNRGGANGVIGTEAGAQAAPDGYTLVWGTNTTHAANVSLFKKLSYDPVKDFAPITAIAVGAGVLVAGPNVPVKTVQDLVTLARQSPGKFTFGAASSFSRVAVEQFKMMTGVDLLYVPYKGAPAALTDLMGGQIDVYFDTTLLVMPHVRSGKVRALGVSAPRRIANYDDVPTIAEQGVPGYEFFGWQAIFAPAKTPPELVNRLNAIIVATLKSKEGMEFLGRSAWEPMPTTPAELGTFVQREIERWSKVVQAAKIPAE